MGYLNSYAYFMPLISLVGLGEVQRVYQTAYDRYISES